LLLAQFLPARSPEAAGQLTLHHGTVVIVFFSNDRVVLAADSRRTFSGGRRGYEDTRCKVSDLGNDAIFAGAGVSGYDFGPEQTTPVFDTRKTAQNVARSLPGATPDRARAIAEGWARQVKMALDEQLTRHPDEIFSSLHGSSNLLASGVFAGRKAGSLAAYYVAINCECSGSKKFSSVHITQLRPTGDGLPAASVGTAEAQRLFSELVDAGTPRALIERATWPANTHDLDNNVAVTIKTAEFILHHSTDHTIGGPINVVELENDGQVRWMKREKFCK